MPYELKKGDRVQIFGRTTFSDGIIQEFETPDTLPSIAEAPAIELVRKELRRGGCTHVALITLDYSGETRCFCALKGPDGQWRDLQGQRLVITILLERSAEGV
jgi:hypothetical protein